jgi:hypothetical protein
MDASTNGGTTWQSLMADPTPGSGGDCEIAMSANGTWAFLHSTVAIATTQDGGETWTVNPLTAIPASSGLADRSYIESAGDRLLLTYQPNNEPGRIGFTHSDDHGQTWSAPRELGPLDAENANAATQDILVAPAGDRIRVPISLDVEATGLAGTATRTGFAVSEDRGESWTFEPVDTPRAAHASPTTAIDGQGTLYWVYELEDGALGSYQDLQIVVSTDGGDTWSDPHTIGENPAWPRRWADGRSAGGMDLIWQRETGDAVEILVSRVDADGFRTANATLEERSDFVEYTEIKQEADRRVHAVAADLDPDPGVVRHYRQALPTRGQPARPRARADARRR